MNSTHVAAAGITSMLADLLIYLSHWPLQTLTPDVATSIAGLLVAAAGAAVKIYNHHVLNGSNNAASPPGPTA